MNARLEPYTLLRAEETANGWNEAVKNWQSAGTVKAAVSTAGGALQTQNELLRIESTHTAVTWDAVKTGERLRASDGAVYEVTYVIPGTRRRMAQLFLKRVDPPEGVGA